MEQSEQQYEQKKLSKANAEFSSESARTFAPPRFSLTASNPVVQRLERPTRTERERIEQERPESEEQGEGGPYGTPYESWAEAAAAETFLRTVLIPAEAAVFGSDVAGLYSSFLSREPGDSLERAVFAEGSALSQEFTDCAVMQTEIDLFMRHIAARFSANFSIDQLPANEWTSFSIEQLYGSPKVQRRINYDNPFDAPGNIAGGDVGDGSASSDAGPDERYAMGSVRLYRVTNTEGETTKIIMANDLRYECLDAVDFVPGNPGAGIEQRFTIPLSRLEASGWAYDKPFQVLYRAPEKTIEFTPAEMGNTYPQNPADRNVTRRPEPREEEERDESRGRGSTIIGEGAMDAIN